MEYQFVVGSKILIQGNVFVLLLAVAALIAVVVFVFYMIWKKIRVYEILKYEFVTIIAHKFRTPLTQIKWTLEGIYDLEKDSFKKEKLTDINASNETLIGLTNTLVELTDSGSNALVDYALVRENICDFVGAMAKTYDVRFHKQNIFLILDIPTAGIFVMIDRNRMNFVLQTIFENAINYSFTGKNVCISVKREDHNVSILVKDEGIGIEVGDRSKMLTKFFRSTAAKAMDTEGFGIGLYLANSIVKKHSGKIRFDSEGLNKGATVTVKLPLAK